MCCGLASLTFGERLLHVLQLAGCEPPRAFSDGEPVKLLAHHVHLRMIP
jgi:hypothetical protein